MKAERKKQRLREILSSPGCVETGCVFDPISARISEELGIAVGLFSGSVAALVILGAPDFLLVSLAELADQSGRICRAADELPVIVDADHGFGNALNVMRTVEALEAVGAAGITIEDSDLPPSFETGANLGSANFANPVPLISIDEAVGKMKAAVAARESMVIIARTNAPEFGDLTETVRRAEAYAKTGVEAILIGGRPSLRDLDRLASVVDVPLIVNSTASVGDLASRGVKIAHRGQRPFRAALYAAFITASAVRDGSYVAGARGAEEDAFFDRIARPETYQRWADLFLRPAK